MSDVLDGLVPLRRAWRRAEVRDPDGRRHPLPPTLLAVDGLWLAPTDDAGLREAEIVARIFREALQRAGLAVDVRVARTGQRRDPSVPPERTVRRDQVDAIVAVLRSAGLREEAHPEVVGRWRLADLLDDHEIWQEHAARDVGAKGRTARVRTWVLPKVEDPTRRDALRRAAVREADLLSRLGRHPNILGLLERVDQDDLPRLVFDAFEGGLPLHRFLRQHPTTTFDEKLRILEQVALALDHCHRNETTHRNLSPDAVLVRVGADGPEVRLHRFEGALARQAEATTLGTRHLSYFTERLDELYRAPEIYRDPDTAEPASDLFSLGALAWFTFTGKHPGPTLPERSRQLREDEGLRLWRVRDDLDGDLDDAIAAATREAVPEREAAVRKWLAQRGESEPEPSVRNWIAGVIALYREPDDADAQPVDPLRAEPGDLLEQGLRVVSVLGNGASARVLAVQSDGQRKALKVPHSGDAAELLAGEAQILGQISHPGVVALEDELTLSGRRCLLLQYAGEETLGGLVRRQGTLALDYGKRLGDELFEVLEHLQARALTHRDIKPTNLAFTNANKDARRLLLYDFSLASLPPDRIQSGTPGWRDPWLERRGAWDHQADLYAAAAVLHYALTGERPAYKEREGCVRVVDTRFDPDLRGALAGFFRRAFQPDARERFADAADARHAWNEVFARDVTSPPHDARSELDPRLQRARLETPIGGLGLSARALNALERAGVSDVRDLLALPRNRISLVRGVGSEIRAEIGRVADALRDRLGSRDDALAPPLLPDAGLLPLPLAEAGLGLPDAAVDALRDAGLRTLRDLAEATPRRLRRLLAPHGVDVDALRSAVGVHAAPIEGAIGDWVSTLLRPNTAARRTAWEKRVGPLFGLDPVPSDEAPPGGRTNAQVAAALGDTLVQFRASFQKARQHWDRDPSLRDAVVAAIGEALDRVGPVATIPEVADALLEAHAPAQRQDARARTQAIAVARLGTEIGIPESAFCWRRLGRHAWLARSEAALDALHTVARVADRLAAEDAPAPADVVEKALRPAALPPLDGLSPDLLAVRAVDASDRAALSPRLELYPRGLGAKRAVELSAAVLAPGLDADAVRKRVSARYPDAEPLPARPALDALLERVGLHWSSDVGAYVRPGVSGATATHESWKTSSGTWVDGGPRPPAAVRADRFQETLTRSLESGRFRVIQVSARQAEEAVQKLRDLPPGLAIDSLDRLLYEGLVAKIREARAERAFVLSVDRQGPAGPHWEALVSRFVRPVAVDVVDRLLSDRRRPRLLVHPGLLARYGLGDVLDRLVRRTEDEDGAAIWLLVPSWNDGGLPLVRHPLGDLPVPVYKPAQRLRAPHAWLAHAPEDDSP